jgi:hypothetical protein
MHRLLIWTEIINFRFFHTHRQYDFRCDGHINLLHWELQQESTVGITFQLTAIALHLLIASVTRLCGLGDGGLFSGVIVCTIVVICFVNPPLVLVV